MIALRRIGGRILESIYIARGPDGTAMDTTFQQICATSDQIRRDLETWEQQLEGMALKPSLGLAALYCDWQNMALPQTRTEDAQRGYRHMGDTSACLDLIERGISHMKGSHITRYRDLFQAVRNKVYSRTSVTETSPMESIHVDPTAPPEPYATSEGLTFDVNDEMVYSMGDGVEAYMNQVNELLDGGGFDVDEALNAWYEALMEEMQGN
ncbi:hypothetical protein NW759_008344 [Fusarium solani]|nr:hypothetical protein NW759_008344 [Fusarium solani]